MRTRLRRLHTALSIGTVAFLATTATATAAAVGAPATGIHLSRNGYSVQIRRTEYGIPHVLAGDYGSLGMINGRVAGTDGLGAPGFTLSSLQSIMLNNRDFSAEDALADLVAMCRANPTLTASNGQPVDVRAACDTLAGWDGRGDLTSQGAVLWRQFAAQPLQSDPSLVPFDPAHPLTMPSGLDGDDRDLRQAFADAVQFFQANHIPVDVTLAQTQRYDGVSVPGCSGGEGCFDVVQPQPLATTGTYPDLSLGAGHGSSFIMAVELTPSGPRAATLLTYSESANPDSPHHIDQTELFAHQQWVTDEFTAAQLNADPRLQVTTLRG